MITGTSSLAERNLSRAEQERIAREVAAVKAALAAGGGPAALEKIRAEHPEDVQQVTYGLTGIDWELTRDAAKRLTRSTED